MSEVLPVDRFQNLIVRLFHEKKGVLNRHVHIDIHNNNKREESVQETPHGLAQLPVTDPPVAPQHYGMWYRLKSKCYTPSFTRVDLTIVRLAGKLGCISDKHIA